MFALIYNNKGKDADSKRLKNLLVCLDEKKIVSKIITDDDLKSEFKADVLFVLGGDGTILCLNEFANRNEIPIIGINTGELGFLTEFESSEIADAVNMFANGQLKIEFRTAIDVFYNDKSYCALNDAYVQRFYSESAGRATTEVKVNVDGVATYKYKGDGVIISTPTGATAYSLSAGGSILAPNVDAFCVTPIAVHNFNQRPIVYSADSKFKVEIDGCVNVGLFADGHHISNLNKGDCFEVVKSKKQTMFLRKGDFNFIKRLQQKFRSKEL